MLARSSCQTGLTATPSITALRTASNSSRSTARVPFSSNHCQQQQQQRRVASQAASSSTRGSRSARMAAAAAAEAGGPKMTVLVAGGAGRTGKLVVEQLLAGGAAFEARALVRSQQSADQLAAALPQTPAGAIAVADIAQEAGGAALAQALKGCDALVVATSAVPQMTPGTSPPEFTWKEGQTPEEVDWLGAKAQIDAAKAAGVRKVVVVGSMGGTQPDNMLNKIANGQILTWKRKAEQYLTTSGLDYTIIHPGGLVDEEGGKRELMLGVDDTLLQQTTRTIPRADVAWLVVQSLSCPAASNRSFDAIAKAAGEGTPGTGLAELLEPLAGASCDYGINPAP